MTFVPVVTPGIAKMEDDETYKSGMEANVFLSNYKDQKEAFVGKSWPGQVVFPDFNDNKTSDWWSKTLTKFQSMVPFDGLSLNMNEAENACDGYCDSNSGPAAPVKYSLPYTPTGRDLEE